MSGSKDSLRKQQKRRNIELERSEAKYKKKLPKHEKPKKVTRETLDKQEEKAYIEALSEGMEKVAQGSLITAVVASEGEELYNSFVAAYRTAEKEGFSAAVKEHWKPLLGNIATVGSAFLPWFRIGKWVGKAIEPGVKKAQKAIADSLGIKTNGSVLAPIKITPTGPLLFANIMISKVVNTFDLSGILDIFKDDPVDLSAFEPADEPRFKDGDLVDWQVDPREKKEVRIIPRWGKPYVKIAFITSEGYMLDFAFYIHIISLQWQTNESHNIDQFSITCVYHPDMRHLTTGFEICPLIGTTRAKAIVLGAFFFTKMSRDRQPDKDTAELYFAAVNYATTSNAPAPDTQIADDDTYEKYVKIYASQLKYKLDIPPTSRLTELRKIPELIQPISPLKGLSLIATELDMYVQIVDRTIIMYDKTATDRRVKYRLNIRHAKSMRFTRAPYKAYTGARVVSHKLQADGAPIVGVAKDSTTLPGQQQEKIITRFMHVKDKKEADIEARRLLNVSNSNISEATVTIPDCVVYAGHDLEIDDDYDYPYKYRIVQSNCSITPDSWTTELSLREIKYDDQTENFNKVSCVVKHTEQYMKAQLTFTQQVFNPQQIKKSLEAIWKNYKDYLEPFSPIDVPEGWETPAANVTRTISRMYLSQGKYPEKFGAVTQFNKAVKTFKDEAMRIEKSLETECGLSLASIGKYPEQVIDDALETYKKEAGEFLRNKKPDSGPNRVELLEIMEYKRKKGR